METKYSIGLDYGTNSVRAVIINVKNGSQVGEGVFHYTHGNSGVLTHSSKPLMARQHPQDYIDGYCEAVTQAVRDAQVSSDFTPDKIIGIGVDTTGSSPMPIDKDATPLALKESFTDNPDAWVWLWKDHTSYEEAEKINTIAGMYRPQFLSKIGGSYSSEWFWAKIWHALRVNPEVFDAAYTWIEIADWIPASLCEVNDADKIKRGICAAGHKALYHQEWNGYPDKEFLEMLDPKMKKLKATLPSKAGENDEIAGHLSSKWAQKMGIPAGIPVAMGAFDAHYGGIGSGIAPGTLIKNIGTSCCDIMVAPLSDHLMDIPGLCGIVPGSVLPGHYGLEAGQSAIGDIFGWFVNVISRGSDKKAVFREIENEAEKIAPGESGLIALDWMNGNRTILVDQRLTGLFVGMTLHTTAAEMYRALVEATAFGARIIAERFEEYGVPVERVINCGGIPYKSTLLMQIYADVFGKTMELSQSHQTAALGSAIAGAVVAGSQDGGYDNYADASKSMTGVLATRYEPNPSAVKIYNQLYPLYKELHDSFGMDQEQRDLSHIMKKLMHIRDSVKGATSK